MRERKLDEVFEESLTAYLEEGRSVEDSLLLYPEFRGELEPLLRTALEVSAGFQAFSPPVAVQERGLARFLSDARGRARLNDLRRETRPGWFARLFARPERFGLAAGGVAVAALAVALGIVLMGGDSDGNESDRVSNPEPTRFEAQDDERPSTVVRLQDTMRSIKSRVSDNESVAPSEVEELRESVRDLWTDDEVDPVAVVITIQELDEVLIDLVAVQPEMATQADEIRGLAGIPVGSLPTPIVDPQPTIAAAPTDPPVATAEPTAAPTAEPTPEPTPAPTEVPTAPPSPTGEERVPGFVPLP
jgi:hypothetical protein